MASSILPSAQLIEAKFVKGWAIAILLILYVIALQMAV